LIIAGLSYIQDKNNNEAGDAWQLELVSTVQDGRRQLDAAEKEAQHLRDRVAELEAMIARIASAQAAGSPAKRATPAAHRVSSPAKAMPSQ
jgi:hypothetical protein